MSNGQSRSDLIGFLGYQGEKGLIPASTAAARRISVAKVLGVLSDEEAADVFALPVDTVMTRFENLNRQKYTPGSLQAYRSRLRSSLDDFSAYLQNPLGFKSVSKSRAPRSSIDREAKARAEPMQAPAPASVSNPIPSVHILPIAIRPDAVVQVAGLPFDLTQAEARKIANIILAHAIAES